MHGLLCLRCGHHLRSGGGRAGLALAGGGGIGGRTNALCCAALSLHCRRCWVANARPSSGPRRVSSPRPHWWCAVCSTAVRWNHPPAQARGEARHRTVLTSSTQKARRRIGSALPTSRGYRPAARARLASLGRAGHCRRRPPSSPSVCTWYCLAPPCGLRLDPPALLLAAWPWGGAPESNRRPGCGLGRRHGRVVVRCLPALLACLSPAGLRGRSGGRRMGRDWGGRWRGPACFCSQRRGGVAISTASARRNPRFRVVVDEVLLLGGWCCRAVARCPGAGTRNRGRCRWSWMELPATCPHGRAPIRRPPVAQRTAGGFAVLLSRRRPTGAGQSPPRPTCRGGWAAGPVLRRIRGPTRSRKGPPLTRRSEQLGQLGCEAPPCTSGARPGSSPRHSIESWTLPSAFSPPWRPTLHVQQYALLCRIRAKTVKHDWVAVGSSCAAGRTPATWMRKRS